MNIEFLLSHFDRISDAPEAVPRLRQFILDSAVRGELVRQNANDEPAAALLTRNDYTRRATAGKDRRADAYRQELLAAENRWNIPPTWNWSALADLVLFIDYRGKTPTKTEKGVRLITAKNVKKGLINVFPEEFLSEADYRTWMTRGLPQEGDVLFTTEAPMGNAAVVRGSERFALAQRVICFRPYGAIAADFLTLLLLSEPFQSILIATATGLTAKGIKAAKLTRLPVAVPPLPEQNRIVSRVNELMALCDRLDAARVKRENQRNRLVTASHHHLNNGADGEGLRIHAQFFLRNLPRFTSHPDQVKPLRETILTLATRGKLVSQIEQEEPASTLLRRVQAEQEDLLRRRVIKGKLLNASDFQDDPISDIPRSWQWTKLSRLLVFGPQNGISPSASSRPDAPKAITLTATTSGVFKPNHFKKIEANVPRDSEFWLRQGDLLFQRGNTREYVGMAAYFEGEDGQFLYPDLIIKVRVSKFVDLRFVHLCSTSPYARAYFGKHATGAQATMPKINHDILLNLPIPLPPLAEQHRIVAKVKALMGLCDDLEKKLETIDSDKGALLASVVYNALDVAAQAISV